MERTLIQRELIIWFEKGYREIVKKGNFFYFYDSRYNKYSRAKQKLHFFAKQIYHSDYSLEEVIREVTKTEPKSKKEVITMPKELANKKLKIEEQAIIFWNKFLIL